MLDVVDDAPALAVLVVVLVLLVLFAFRPTTFCSLHVGISPFNMATGRLVSSIFSRDTLTLYP